MWFHIITHPFTIIEVTCRSSRKSVEYSVQLYASLDCMQRKLKLILTMYFTLFQAFHTSMGVQLYITYLHVPVVCMYNVPKNGTYAGVGMN